MILFKASNYFVSIFLLLTLLFVIYISLFTESEMESFVELDAGLEPCEELNVGIESLVELDAGLEPCEELNASIEPRVEVNACLLPRVEVLLYHSLEPGGSETWPVIAPDVFYMQLNHLLEEGWQPLTLEEYTEWVKGEKELDQNSFLLTFDDGTESIYEYAFPFLLENEIPAVVFLIAKHHDPHYESSEVIWVPKLKNEQIEEMHQSLLVTFQSHTYDLHREIDGIAVAVTASSNSVFEDLLKSKEVITALTGKQIYCIAYPYGVANCEIVEAAEKAGFRLGFVLDGHDDDDLLRINRISLDNYSLDQFKNYFKF